MTFAMVPLAVDRSAVAPVMSEETFAFHYDKHYAAYVNNLNALLPGSPYEGKSMEEIVRASHASGDKKAYNNAGQSWNHAFFWRAIGADGARRPQGALAQAIDAAFGGFDAFADKFKAEGVGHFASGWAWLVSDAAGAVSVTSTHDAEPVFLSGKTALLVCDVWEHAYYIDHRNNRAAFLEGYIKSRANWDFAEAQYAAAKAGQFGWTYG